MSTTARAIVRTLLAAAAGGVVGAAVGRGLDGVGTHDGERAAPMPGDELHGAGALVRTRAVAIAAPATDVWPWLVQMGWGRAGWYSLDAVERPLGAARSLAADGTVSWRSLRAIAPQHQGLAVGDPIPLRGDLGFEVVALEPGRHLVAVFEGVGSRMVWTLLLRDHGEACRLVVRTAFAADGLVAAVATRVLLDPGHAVMELVQLQGIRERAEAG